MGEIEYGYILIQYIPTTLDSYVYDIPTYITYLTYMIWNTMFTSYMNYIMYLYIAKSMPANNLSLPKIQ